jgi:hypothetical protein
MVIQVRSHALKSFLSRRLGHCFSLCLTHRLFRCRRSSAGGTFAAAQRPHDRFDGGFGGSGRSGRCGPDRDFLYASGARFGGPDNRALGFAQVPRGRSHGSGKYKDNNDPNAAMSTFVPPYFGNIRPARRSRHSRRRTLRWQRKKPKNSMSYFTTR